MIFEKKNERSLAASIDAVNFDEVEIELDEEDDNNLIFKKLMEIQMLSNIFKNCQ